MIRKVARRIVSDAGYQVGEAENGQEALAKCKIAMPDLILLDWDMPVMTGLEFLTALRVGRDYLNLLILNYNILHKRKMCKTLCKYVRHV